MTITAVIVVYAVTWFMCLFIVLPIRVTTQNDTGQIIPGTAPSAPVATNLRLKLRWVTLIATLVWAVLCGIILSGTVTINDIDLFGVLSR